MAKEITAPPKPEPISAAKASKLLKEREQLETDRLEWQRNAESNRKKVAAIDAELVLFVEANKRGKVRSVTLKAWRLTVATVPKGIYWKGIVEGIWTAAKIVAYQKSLGTKDELTVEAIKP